MSTTLIVAVIITLIASGDEIHVVSDLRPVVRPLDFALLRQTDQGLHTALVHTGSLLPRMMEEGLMVDAVHGRNPVKGYKEGPGPLVPETVVMTVDVTVDQLVLQALQRLCA